MASLSSIHCTTPPSPTRSPQSPGLPRLHSKPRVSISCSSSSQSQENEAVSSCLKSAASMALSSILFTSSAADIAGLTPCKESKAFAEREKQSLEKLEASLDKYVLDSVLAQAIKATLEKTKRQFKNYGKFSLLSSSDSLPRLIGDQRLRGFMHACV